MSQARTAGRTFRVWQIQRQIDGDVDALSASKQEDLGRFLARTGGDGRRTYTDLREKLITQAMLDEDPLAIVTTREYRSAYSDQFENLKDAVKRHPRINSDVTIKITVGRDFD